MKYSVIALACVLAVASAQYQYTTIRPSAYRPWVTERNEASRSVYNRPLTATLRPVFASQSSYTAKPVFSASSFPARSVFPTASAATVKPELTAQPSPTPAATLQVSAFPARSAVPTPSASRSTWSISAPKVSEVSVLPAVRVAPVEPAIVAKAPPVYPTAKLASFPVPRYTNDGRTAVPAVRVAAPPVAPVAQEASVVSFKPVVAQESPVFPAAKISSFSVPRYANDARAAETLKFVNEMHPNGAYDYAYETNNGIFMQSQGSPRSFYSGEDAVSPVVSQGAFGWTSPDGKDISITYFADESGYHASGSAIPVAPEIPPLIARALEYLKKHAATE